MARISSTPVAYPVPPELDDHRMVYNGDETPPPVNEPLRRNRPVRRKQRSPFRPMFVLMMISIFIVFYIWNKIAVNRLATEVNDLENQYRKLVNSNGLLQAEITQKSNRNRIEKIAGEQLKMIYPKEQSLWFEIDQPRVKQSQTN
ncbi:MAG: cell division protein FtsL [Bacteroidota bacterium]